MQSCRNAVTDAWRGGWWDCFAEILDDNTGGLNVPQKEYKPAILKSALIFNCVDNSSR